MYAGKSMFMLALARICTRIIVYSRDFGVRQKMGHIHRRGFAEIRMDMCVCLCFLTIAINLNKPKCNAAVGGKFRSQESFIILVSAHRCYKTEFMFPCYNG